MKAKSTMTLFFYVFKNSTPEYCCVLTPSAFKTRENAELETVQRTFALGNHSPTNQNYRQRLKSLRLDSRERRQEIQIKLENLEGLVPNLRSDIIPKRNY